MVGPLSYIGGKNRLAKRIIEIFPKHTAYVEAFAGGAQVFFQKESSKVEVLNDLDGEIVNFYRVCQAHHEELLRYFRFALVSRKWFELHKAANPETLTDIQRAARYLYLLKNSFARQWDPYSKAKYLHELREIKAMPLGTLVEYCGGREKEIIQSINAFSDMEAHYRPIVEEGNFDTSRFSGFVELQKPGIKKALLEAGFTLADFAKWIRDEKLYPLHTVRLLPRILHNTKAREAFLKSDARRAAEFLERPELTKALSEANLSQIASALTQTIYQLPWLEAEKLRSDPNGVETQLLNEALEAIRGVLKLSEDDS